MGGQPGEPAPRLPTMLTPRVSRRPVPRTVFPARGVFSTGNSAMNQVLELSHHMGLGVPRVHPVGQLFPQLPPEGDTWVLPASSRMSTESSSEAMDAMGTSGATSRTVRAILVLVTSSRLARTSRADPPGRSRRWSGYPLLPSPPGFPPPSSGPPAPGPPPAPRRGCRGPPGGSPGPGAMVSQAQRMT
jgi:hypothetical protein